MSSTITIQFECLIFDKGASKESIKQQYTAGTFGRPLSSYDRYFSNVPYFLNRDARKSSNMANFGRFLYRKIGGTFAENVPFLTDSSFVWKKTSDKEF